ncbi:hypothetical protein VP249E411_P0251 [Vibrio phage 249E41-1]|nr:hypothetical protein VP249E411_P0251 [Vibrio phage 249E41-1]CAH9014816.1 hypothetical protein VP496E541_P0246 [Vibrio phage 496E54-1]CAH9017527.1 hypothetical protein VP193E371_P0250 [Vibrio phage 193E37-1]
MNNRFKVAREKMELAYIDWFVDNPADEKLKAKFFRLQKAYKKLKGEK